MDTLPPELIRYFVPFLPLTSLIAARCVNTRWRTLAQSATLHPARKTLLEIYLTAIIHPNFPSLVEALEPHVSNLDREGYLEYIKSEGCAFPDIFEFWVLEWPTKAFHFWAWPGMRMESSGKITHDYYCRGYCNMLSEGYHLIRDDVPIPNGQDDGKTCRALSLWGIDGEIVLWLVVDPDEEINDRLAGSVVWTIENATNGYELRILDDPPFQTPNFAGFLKLLDVKNSTVESAVDRLED